MLKLRIIIIIPFFITALAQNASAAPSRIVSLKPNITEILFALGAGDRVVGVTKYCDYPGQAKKLPKVADYTRPFLEPIIALKPDLVIGSEEESSRKASFELKRLGINVVWFPFTTLEETLSSIRNISELVGRPEKGAEIVNEMRERMGNLSQKWASSGNTKVLIVVGLKPLIVAGQGTYINEVLSIAGAQNAVSGRSIRYPKWSLENVIASNPDVIIDMSMGSESPDAGSGTNPLESWRRLTTVSAVRNKKIYSFDLGVLRQSPRLIEGIEKLGRIIHSPPPL